MLLHQFFGEDLARLDAGGFPGGAEDGNAEALKAIDDAGRQWCFRPDHHQVDAGLLCGAGQCLDVLGFDGQVMGQRSGAGVTRGRVNLLYFRALGDFPDQGVFSRPTPDYQYFQSLPPGNFRVTPSPVSPSPGEFMRGRGIIFVREASPLFDSLFAAMNCGYFLLNFKDR